MTVLSSSRLHNGEWMCRVWIAVGLTVCLLLVASPPRSLAQEFRATLTGQITDPTGAVVTDAVVTAVNNDTGSIYTDKTSNAGVYYIPYVVPGTYTVTVKAEGFKTAIQDRVELLAGKYTGQNFKLEVGSFHETMEVSTAPPLLETADASGGTILDEKTLQSVPLNGRQVYMLIGTTPGSQITSQAGPGGNSGTRGWDVSNAYIIGGGPDPSSSGSSSNFTSMGGFNQFTLNGTNITAQTTYDNQSAAAWTVAPNLDAIQEVNVMDTIYDARYGRTTGGIVNIVTKNGTNEWHGTLYEGYKGGFMDANTLQNVFMSGAPTQQQVENQFSGTVGGPVIKNKLFFFFSFEGYRQSIHNLVSYNVPPAYLRPGYVSAEFPNGNPDVDFGLVAVNDPGEFPNGITLFQPGDSSNAGNPNDALCSTGGPVGLCNQLDVYFPNQFVGGTKNPTTGTAGSLLPHTLFNPTALAVMSYIPLPNIPSAANLVSGNNYAVTEPALYSYNQPMTRVDYDSSDKTKWYSSFEWQKGHENSNGNGLPGIAANGNLGWMRENWAAAQDMTHTFSPTFVGDFKLSFSRYVASTPDGNFSDAKPASSIGLNMPLPPTALRRNLPEISGVFGGQTIFGNSSNLDMTEGILLDVDFTKSKGAHTIFFGGGIGEFQYANPGNKGSFNGNFSFNGAFTQFNPFNEDCYQPTSSACGSTSSPNGSAWADFLLGLPSGGGIDWNRTLFEYQPVWNLYAQDNWRVTHRLVLNLGLRYDVQVGLRERNDELTRGMCLTCVNPLTYDGVYQANIANPANIAAWTAAGINVASLKTVYGGVVYQGQKGQPAAAYNTDYSNLAPRIGFAFSFNPKTVFRGGWGLMYGAGLEGGSPIGFSQTTSYQGSTNGGFDPNQGFGSFLSGSPFPPLPGYPTGLLPPTGSAAGLMTGVGQLEEIDFPNRKIPRTQFVTFGFQHELPSQMTLDARFSGNYASRLRSFLWLDGTATYPQLQYAFANPGFWSNQVPNPYYQVFAMSGPGLCGTQPTIDAVDLMYGFSQYCSPGGNNLVGQYNAAIGRNWYNGLEAKLTKRTTHGLTFNVAYTWSKNINGDGYLNGWPYRDPEELHWIGLSDRTNIFTMTGVWDLPFGKGKDLASHPPRAVGYVIDGWSLSWVFGAQTGTPVSGLPNNYDFGCSFVPAGGSSVSHWINPNTNSLSPNSCATLSPLYAGVTRLQFTPSVTPTVRTPTVPNLDLSLEKSIPVTERVKFTLRGDAFNALNSALLGGPDVSQGDPMPNIVAGACTPLGAANCKHHYYWSGYGTVAPSQVNFPRNLRISGKITF